MKKGEEILIEIKRYFNKNYVEFDNIEEFFTPQQQ